MGVPIKTTPSPPKKITKANKRRRNGAENDINHVSNGVSSPKKTDDELRQGGGGGGVKEVEENSLPRGRTAIEFRYDSVKENKQNSIGKQCHRCQIEEKLSAKYLDVGI